MKFGFHNRKKLAVFLPQKRKKMAVLFTKKKFGLKTFPFSLHPIFTCSEIINIFVVLP